MQRVIGIIVGWSFVTVGGWGAEALAADLAVEVFLFDQDDAVLTDDVASEVCNPCAFTVPSGSSQLQLTLSGLVFKSGGSWPAGLTAVQFVVYVSDAAAGVALRPTSGASPTLDATGTFEARTLPSGVSFGGSTPFEQADLAMRPVIGAAEIELAIVHPEVM